jgi:hypothetical protein
LEGVYIEMARVKAGIDPAPGLARAVQRRGVPPPTSVDDQKALPLPIHAHHPRLQRYVESLKQITQNPSATADYEHELQACTQKHFPPRYTFDPFTLNAELNQELALRAVAALAAGVKAIDDVAFSPQLPGAARPDLVTRTHDCSAALRQIRKRFHPAVGIADIADGPPQYATEVHACLAQHFPPRITPTGLLEEVTRYCDKVSTLIRGNVTAYDVEEMTHRTNHALFWLNYVGIQPTFEPVKWADPANTARQFSHFAEILREFVWAHPAE